MTAPPSNRDQSRAHEGANIGSRCVSYFTLRTIIIFMETIKDLYQTLAPLASRKALERFCPSPGSSHLKHGTANLRPSQSLGIGAPRPKDPPGIGSHWRIPARIGEAEETPRIGRPPPGRGPGGLHRTQSAKQRQKYLYFKEINVFLSASVLFLSVG